VEDRKIPISTNIELSSSPLQLSGLFLELFGMKIANTAAGGIAVAASFVRFTHPFGPGGGSAPRRCRVVPDAAGQRIAGVL